MVLSAVSLSWSSGFSTWTYNFLSAGVSTAMRGALASAGAAGCDEALGWLVPLCLALYSARFSCLTLAVILGAAILRPVDSYSRSSWSVTSIISSAMILVSLV